MSLNMQDIEFLTSPEPSATLTDRDIDFFVNAPIHAGLSAPEEAPQQPAQAPEEQWHEQPDDVGLAGDYHFDLDAFSPETGRKVGRALEGAWHEVKGVPGALATSLRSHHQIGSQNLEMDEITRPTDIVRMSELTRSGVPIEEARKTVIAERDVRRQSARDAVTEALRGLETAVMRDPNPEFDERSDSFLEGVSRGTASFLPIMGITAASPATGAVMTYGLIQGMKQQELEEAGQVVFRYADPKTGSAGAEYAPNGALNGIAGICNKGGNILGLMPHPERSTVAHLNGGTDRGDFWRSIAQDFAKREAL